MSAIVTTVRVLIRRSRPTLSDSHPPSGLAKSTTNKLAVFARRNTSPPSPVRCLRRSTANVNVR